MGQWQTEDSPKQNIAYNVVPRALTYTLLPLFEPVNTINDQIEFRML